MIYPRCAALLGHVSLILALATFGEAGSCFAAGPKAIQHSFIAFGGETKVIDAEGHQTWSFPESTRDGFVLPDGNYLLTLSKSDKHKGGAVVEVMPDGKTIFSWEGTQSEVNTAQKLPNGNIMVTEAGDHPRILEINPAGSIVVVVPIQCQTSNHHMESRMTRKLQNGNYLVPQLLDKVVREYTPAGKIVWEFKTPDEPKESWPFTAIRLSNGHTLINCTHGNHVIEVNRHGKIVWQLTNADLPSPLLKDPCGAQRLPNGNTVITSYAAGDQTVKLIEVNRKKKVVWTYESSNKTGIHEFQILDTNGKSLPWPPLK
jgi:outer membrane protein assembly factor BamB